MSFEEKKSRLGRMLGEQSVDAPKIGKSTGNDNASGNDSDNDNDNDTGRQDARAGHAEHGQGGMLEGGKGEPAPAPATATPTAGAPAAPASGKTGGTVAITSSGTSKGAGAPIAKVAVGEKVTFSSPEDGWWTFDGKQIGDGTSIEWQAPNTATVGNLRFENNQRVTGSKPVLVVAPTKVKFTKLGDVPSAGPDMAGVGMNLQVTIESTDVSFKDVEWLERPGPAAASGYFATYGAGKLFHNPEASWLPMGADNKAIIDNAWSRDKPKLEHPDGKGKRWWAGSFSWTIPNAYKVNGVEKNFDTVTQTFTMTDDGTMTVTKGGCSASAKPNSVTEGNDVRKFKDVNEAAVYLRPHGNAGMLQAALNYKRDPKADAASVTFLAKALTNANLTLRAEVSCSSTYAWTGPDQVTITANGAPAKTGKKSINTGKSAQFDFELNKALDLSKLATSPVTLAGVMSDFTSNHAQSATITYPYNGVEGAFSDRYSYRTFIT